MTLMEVEARLQNKERAMRLQIESIPKGAPIVLDAHVQGIGHDEWRVEAIDDSVITLSRNALQVAVPLTYVEAVHPTAEPGAQWVLGLSCVIYAIPMGAQPKYLQVRRYNI